MRKYLILTICLSLFGAMQQGYAQQAARILTLEECIAIAQNRSPEAQIARAQYESAWWAYRAFRGGLKPQVALSGSTPGFSRAIVPNIRDDGSLAFVFQNQANSNLNLGIEQQIGPTGATLSISSNLNRIDVFGDNGYTSWQSTPLLLGLRQPLFRYNSFRWDQKLEPQRFLLAERQYVEQLEDIAIDISGKFFDVYLNRIQMETSRKNLSINDSIFTISKGRFRVGKIAENDLLQTELAYQNALLNTERNELGYIKAREDLAISLGFSDANIEVIPPEDLPEFDVELEFALEQARQNRSDLVGYRIRELEAEANVARTRSNNNFSADISATFGLNQTGETFSEAYTQPPDQETFGISFSIPIFSWGANKARVESALIAHEQARKQVQLDQRRLIRNIKFQVLDFMQLRKQLTLSARADTIALRRFDVAKKRYLIGKIDITNLQLAQGEKDNARQTYFSTLRNFWVSYFSLRRATLYDFVNREPLRVRDQIDN